MGVAAPHAPGLRLLQAASFTSSFDRFVVGPLLLAVAAAFGTGLAQVAAVASAYFLAYGLAQPLWGLCSDRLGRGPTLRLALAGAAVFGVASAAAPSLGALVLCRVAAGACIAAAVPTSMVWVGDVVPFARRQGVLTDLNAATAAGITSAIALGGVLAGVSWRLGFLLPAVLAGLLAVAMARLPEPERTGGGPGRLRAVLGDRTGRLVLLLALVEGGALLGLLTYLPPAAESAGASRTAAGLLVALFGIGLLLASRVVKRLAARTAPPVFVAVGATALVLAYAGLAVSQSPPVVAVAALLVGAGWSAMHSTMQTWATEAVPAQRALMVSLFAAALFVGAGAATSLLAPLAGELRWGAVFGAGAGVAAVFGTAAVTALRRTARQARTAASPYP